ncbi:MAG: Fe-S cluster assembly protein SufD [Alphaproteobacteria bacterium]|nr:Fe-S cluster assembly protein SufD [Alphaproteobacteria bacterium]
MTDLKAYIDAFAARPRGADDARRRDAVARAAELGLPTRRQESWRFTNLRAFEKTFFPPAASSKPVSVALPAPYRVEAASHRLVLVNGRFAPELSDLGALPAGLSLRALSQLGDLRGMTDGPVDNAFVALNAALFDDGFALTASDAIIVERVIEIVHLGHAEAPLSAHTRNRVSLGAGSSCTVIESFTGSGPYWVNDAIEIEIGAGATLRHAVLQDDAAPSVHLSHRRVKLAKGARYDGFTLTLGAELSRQDTQVTIAGEDAHCALNGAYLLRGSQEATIATLIDHAAPASETREVFKGVVDERAHGVFQGKIQVRQAAQKTNAHQLNRNLLLSPRAAADTKPELEIYADDVKCSHGATVGDLDEAALFYLVSRGLPEAEARRMLIEAFAADALDLISDAAAKDYLRRHLDRWLAHRRD